MNCPWCEKPVLPCICNFCKDEKHCRYICEKCKINFHYCKSRFRYIQLDISTMNQKYGYICLGCDFYCSI